MAQELQDVVQVVDLANLFIAIASLVIALMALFISKRLAGMGISRPFILQGLYQLYEDLHQLQRQDTIEGDIDRAFKMLKLVRNKSLILEQMGFGDILEEIEGHVTNFQNLRSELANESDEVLRKKGDALIQHLRSIDLCVLSIQAQLKPRLQEVLKDPLNQNGSLRTN